MGILFRRGQPGKRILAVRSRLQFRTFRRRLLVLPVFSLAHIAALRAPKGTTLWSSNVNIQCNPDEKHVYKRCSLSGQYGFAVNAVSQLPGDGVIA